jgi:predicted PurR-regulated permease PerM
MKDLKTTNTLLLLLVIPVVFYVLKIMSFIFIPLVLSMFISVLFLPMMRWLQKMKIPKNFRVLIVVFVVIITLWGIVRLMILSGSQVVEHSGAFLGKAKEQMNSLIISIESVLGGKISSSDELFSQILEKINVSSEFGPAIAYFKGTFTMILMTAFFVILWLAESINIQQIIKSMMTDHKYGSVKTFLEIEKDLITFVRVKVIVSLLLGVSTGLICYFFGLSFPIFWGLFALFAVYVQLIGPLLQVVLMTLFAIVEFDVSSHFLFFMLAIILAQILIGSVLEPIFMGKSFSINVITILVMLMLWGYIWGIPGMVLSIPITVFLKIIFEQFPATQGLAILMSGKDNLEVSIANKKDHPDE